MVGITLILDMTLPSKDPTLNLVQSAHLRGDLAEATALTFAACPEGTKAGKPTVMLMMDVMGTPIYGETTLALFLTAADSFKAKYGDPR